MRKIHFVSLFCVDFDHDIMVQWATHIKSYGFDSYKVVLNSPSDNNDLIKKCAVFFLDAGFEIDIDKRLFDNMKLRVGVLKDFQSRCAKANVNDYMCVCDSDELPLFSKNISTVLKNRTDLVFVAGQMVDRFADVIKAGSDDGDLFEQFPIERNLEHLIKQSYEEGTDGSETRLYHERFFEMPREKFLIFPLDCDMDFTGCHVVHTDYARENPGILNTWPTKIKIMHFTWRSGIIERMCLKQFNHPSKILSVVKFFKTEIPQCLLDRIELDKKMRGL